MDKNSEKQEQFPRVCVVFFCHDGRGEFLMQKRSAKTRDERDTWDIGGGGVRFGEKVIDALKKEIEEEYCTKALGYDFLGYRDVHRVNDGQPTHWIALDYKVRVDRAMVKNGEPHKFSEIGWFTFSNLPSPLHSTVPTIFTLYRDTLERF